MMMTRQRLQPYLFEVSGKPRVLITGLPSGQGTLDNGSYIFAHYDKMPALATTERLYRPKVLRVNGKEGCLEIDLSYDGEVMEFVPVRLPNVRLEGISVDGALREIFFDGIVPLYPDELIIAHLTVPPQGLRGMATATNEVARVEVLSRRHLPERAATRIYNFRGHYLGFNPYLDGLLKA